MTIADVTTLLARMRTAQLVTFVKGNSTPSANPTYASLWTTDPGGGNTPTTAVAPTHTTTGALPFAVGGSTTRVLSVEPTLMRTNETDVTLQRGASAILADRLGHQGGLVGNVGTLQTTNLPTAALTRYTSGVGVMAACEVYTAIAGTGVLTVNYTNQAGTSGRASTDINFVNAVVGAFIPIPLIDGDSGVRSVESVQFTTPASTAGNFGITLFRPIGLYPMRMPPFRGQWAVDPFASGANLEPMVANACLMIIVHDIVANRQYLLACRIGVD